MPLLYHHHLAFSIQHFLPYTNLKNRPLAAELVVRAKTLNPPNFRYGCYRIWGDLHKSRYFKVEGQSSIEQVIRSIVKHLYVTGNWYKSSRSYIGENAKLLEILLRCSFSLFCLFVQRQCLYNFLAVSDFLHLGD